MRDLIYTVLDEKEKNYNFLFEIFDDWFICNDQNYLDLNFVTNLMEMNYILTSKYYFHLLETKKMQKIAMKIKLYIINFFIRQNKEGKNNAESLISLLLLAPDNQFLLFFLDKLNGKIMKEEDFYQLGENQNFLLFKLFFEKCKDLIKKPDIRHGEYLKRSIEIKNKIYNDLEKNQVKFCNINILINGTNSFYNKILVIDKNKAKEIYDKLCVNLKICQNRLKELEVIEDYYTTFYSNSKRLLINILTKKIKEFKRKNISDIISNEDIIADNDIDINQMIEESKNLKYKNSCFFMSIYIKNRDEDFEKSEDDILKESINNYTETITRIIGQKESKEPFFGINNI
jgi:hypothetical protein